MEGWIKLHRKIIDWEWYDDNNTKSLFLHLLLKATRIEKNYRGVELKKGQVITGYEKLAAETGMTMAKVRKALDNLKSTKEITSESTNKGTIITILNWEQYQIDNENLTNDITIKKQSKDKQKTTNNKYKEYREYKEHKNIFIAPNENELGAMYRLPLLSNESEKVYRYWLIFEDKVEEYKKLYPSVDVEQEIRTMLGWCDSNPSKRKTAKGANKFITSWLERKQNRASIPKESKGGLFV